MHSSRGALFNKNCGAAAEVGDCGDADEASGSGDGAASTLALLAL